MKIKSINSKTKKDNSYINDHSGKIDDYHLDINMSKVGNLNEYQVWIFTREGNNTPHFHLQSKQNDKFIAIKILEPEYFIHGIWKDKLNSKEIKDLINFLNEKPKGKRGLIYNNNFEFIYDTWEWENNGTDTANIVDMPNYNLLKSK